MKVYFDEKGFESTLKEKKGEKTTTVLASEAGLSIANMSRALNNKMLSIDTLTKICNCVQIDPREFFKNKEA